MKNKTKSINFFGFNVFYRDIINDTDLVLIKILNNIISIEYNKSFSTLFIRLFGKTIIKCIPRTKYKIYYFLNIPIFFEKISDKILNSFLDYIISSRVMYEEYYVFTCRSGEFYLLMHHINEWVIKNKYTKFALVLTNPYHENILKLFHIDIPVLLVPFTKFNIHIINNALNNIENDYKGKKFYFPFYHEYFRSLEDSMMIDSNVHFYSRLLFHLGISSKEFSTICVKDLVSLKIQNISKYILNNNFIIISHESVSNSTLNKKFWIELVKQLKEIGYVIFSNCMDYRNSLPNSISIFLTHEEITELSKYSKAIIGLRSGLMDCLSFNKNIPIFVLYTDFKNRLGFRDMPSKNVMTGFSLKNLPNVNENTIFEYDVNSFSDVKKLSNEITKEVCNFYE